MSATGKRRLLKLADFLEKLPKKSKFDMGVYAEDIHDGRPICGTAACAAGWGACIPSFRRAGYKLAIRDLPGLEEKIPVVVFGRYKHGKALERFFDIDGDTADYLFGPFPFNRSRRDAISRIRSVAKKLAA